MKRSDWRILLQLKLYTKQKNKNTEHVFLMPFNGSLQFLLKRITYTFLRSWSTNVDHELTKKCTHFENDSTTCGSNRFWYANYYYTNYSYRTMVYRNFQKRSFCQKRLYDPLTDSPRVESEQRDPT